MTAPTTPAFLRAGIDTTASRPHVSLALRDRVRAIRQALEECVLKSQGLEADLTAATVESIVVDYAATAIDVLRQLDETAPMARDGVLDLLTRAAVDNVPAPVDGREWNVWLRRYTQHDLAMIEGPLMASYRRVAAEAL